MNPTTATTTVPTAVPQIKGDAPNGLWKPIPMKILDIQTELSDFDTYILESPAGYQFKAGQFNMIYMPGYGEAAISLSSDPQRPDRLAHTVRAVGDVTKALQKLQVGQHMLLRGPFGSYWPLDQMYGCDIVIACGGLGLAPLRTAIYHILNHRQQYGRVYLLYGSRSPEDLLYTAEYDQWRAGGIEMHITVDLADRRWRGSIGVVTQLMTRIDWKSDQMRVLSCGPEVMMRFVAYEALGNRVDRDHIFLSMERNMKCAVGFCGHCQMGPTFVCKDGPVFPYGTIESLMQVEDL